MFATNGMSHRRLCTSASLARYGFVAACFTLIISGLFLFRYQPDALRRIGGHFLGGKTGSPSTSTSPSDYDRLLFDANDTQSHPIDRLIADARRVHDSLLVTRSRDVASAAKKYRERRGRHPPPGFDKWVEYALKNDAIVVEPFFDRIYHDIAPFWALDTKTTATRAASWHHVVQVRNGKATGLGNVDGRVPWLDLWTNLVAEAAQWMPDVDMPINYMDESRLLVPWEDINGYIAKEEKGRAIPPVDQTITKYTGLGAVDADINTATIQNKSLTYDPQWTGGKYWEYTRATCSPDSPSRNVSVLTDYSQPPTFPQDWRPDYSYEGYVKNFSASQDVCSQPHMRGMHGTFTEPISMSTATELIPLFGGSKLPNNNEILIPGAMYLAEDERYSGGGTHGPPWAEKTDGIIWRGAGSGGRHKKENWTHFQRQRLIEMLNGTTVSQMESNGTRAMTFEMPPLGRYDFPRRREGKVGEFLSNFSVAGFTELFCFPEDDCGYLDPYFSVRPRMAMKDQYMYKFIPDADGNSFSARWRGLLLSTSVPLKATIYSEWHDDRMQPWLHFVPLENTFQDLHGVLDYFTRDSRGDAAARLIAEMGKEWAETVHRREDMLLYVWRLLLEFSRVCDENRDRLGYVDDLKHQRRFR